MENAVAMSLSSSRAGQSMRLLRAVSTQASIAIQRTTDRRGRNVKLRCNGLLCQTRFLQRVEFYTVVASQAAV